MAIVRVMATLVTVAVRGRAVRVAHGGCTTLPPMIRHNDEVREWQTHETSLKIPDIQQLLRAECAPFSFSASRNRCMYIA
jgi:hypothetical protein